MAESTPHLARATEEVRQQDAAGPLMRTSVPTRTRAHAIVSAALHDPDDPAWLQRVEEEHAYHHASDDNTEVRCGCGHVLWCLSLGLTDGPIVTAGPVIEAAMARHRADAVRAAILGGA